MSKEMADVREIVAHALVTHDERHFDMDADRGIRDLMALRADAILSALDAAGFAVVPREATEDMHEAAAEPFHAAFQEQVARNKRYRPNENPYAFASFSFSKPIWYAMVAAAASQAKEEADG